MKFRFLRTGKVSSISYKKTTARVEFNDSPGIISKPLKILMDHMNTERDSSMPSVGENTVYIFLSHAPNVGFILGSYSSEKNLPKDTGRIKYIIFSDGTKIQYNFETHLLEIDCVGYINIKGANNIVMTTDNLTINAVTTAKNITAEEAKVSKLIISKEDVENKPTTVPV